MNLSTGCIMFELNYDRFIFFWCIFNYLEFVPFQFRTLNPKMSPLLDLILCMHLVKVETKCHLEKKKNPFVGKTIATV